MTGVRKGVNTKGAKETKARRRAWRAGVAKIVDLCNQRMTRVASRR